MKRVVSLITVFLLCVALAVPAFAAEEFVPSITYKEGPQTSRGSLVDENGAQDVEECIVVTTIEQAIEKLTDVTQEERDQLLEIYEDLENGDMTLPGDDDYVVWELFLLGFEDEDCRQDEEHGQKGDRLKKKGVTLDVDFDVDVEPGETVIVMVYVDGEWIPVETKNNGDGTITCVFEDIGPVVFCREKGKTEPPKTGDDLGKTLILWIVLMVASAAAIVVLSVNRRKVTR